MNFQDEIKKLLKKELKQDVQLEIPSNSEHGDYALACFNLAKIQKKNPAEIAMELASKLKSNIFDINNAGPYVNFKIKNDQLASIILPEILKQRDNYGKSSIGKNKLVLIEHTSINPNASPHVGRARNALIGDSIARFYRFLGYKVETHYFVNDVGKQIALLVLGCKGNPKFDDLLSIYIDINKKAESNKGIENEALSLLSKLESGDKAVISRFKRVVAICINGQKQIFSELNIKYDYFDYESSYLWNKSLSNVLKKLESTGKLFTDEHGRKVLNQEEFDFAMKQPFLVLTRADNTSLYPLRDIAYTIDKMKKTSNNIVVLGEDQKLYHQQISAALNILNLKSPEVIHYSFVLLKDEGKMSTREGNLVLLKDFMNELLKKSQEELKKRYKKVDNQLAKKIAYGALKYSILKVSPEKNVVFDWQQALSFEGNSSPYIQYSYARASSILRKAKPQLAANLRLLTSKEEIKLIKLLSKFPEIVLTLKPYITANYAFDLAQSFNEFYHTNQVISKDKQLMAARLQLVIAVKYVLKNALSLLGIEAPEKM